MCCYVSVDLSVILEHVAVESLSSLFEVFLCGDNTGVMCHILTSAGGGIWSQKNKNVTTN